MWIEYGWAGDLDFEKVSSCDSVVLERYEK